MSSLEQRKNKGLANRRKAKADSEIDCARVLGCLHIVRDPKQYKSAAELKLAICAVQRSKKKGAVLWNRLRTVKLDIEKANQALEDAVKNLFKFYNKKEAFEIVIKNQEQTKSEEEKVQDEKMELQYACDELKQEMADRIHDIKRRKRKIRQDDDDETLEGEPGEGEGEENDDEGYDEGDEDEDDEGEGEKKSENLDATMYKDGDTRESVNKYRENFERQKREESIAKQHAIHDSCNALKKKKPTSQPVQKKKKNPDNISQTHNDSDEKVNDIQSQEPPKAHHSSLDEKVAPNTQSSENYKEEPPKQESQNETSSIVTKAAGVLGTVGSIASGISRACNAFNGMTNMVGNLSPAQNATQIIATNTTQVIAAANATNTS